MTEIAGHVEFLHEFGVDDVVREGSRRFDALEPPELGEKVAHLAISSELRPR